MGFTHEGQPKGAEMPVLGISEALGIEARRGETFGFGGRATFADAKVKRLDAQHESPTRRGTPKRYRMMESKPTKKAMTTTTRNIEAILKITLPSNESVS